MIVSFAPQKSGVIGSKRIVEAIQVDQTRNVGFLDFLSDLENSVSLSAINDSSESATIAKRPKVLKRKLSDVSFESPVLLRHVQIEANFNLLPLLNQGNDEDVSNTHWIFPDTSVTNGSLSKTPLRIASSISKEEFWSLSESRNTTTAIVSSSSTPEQYVQFVKSMYLTWQRAATALMTQLTSQKIQHFHVLGESSTARMSNGSDVFVSAVFQSSSSQPSAGICIMIGVSTSLMTRLQALGCDPSILAEETHALSERGMSTIGQMERTSRGVDVVICGRVACQLAMECLKEAVLEYLLKGGSVAKLPLLRSNTYFEGATPHRTSVVADDCKHRFFENGEAYLGETPSTSVSMSEGATHRMHLSGAVIALTDVKRVVKRLMELGRAADEALLSSSAAAAAAAGGAVNKESGVNADGKKRKAPSAAYSYLHSGIHAALSNASTTGYNAALWRNNNTTGGGVLAASALSNPMTIVINKAVETTTTTAAVPAPIAAPVVTTNAAQMEEPYFLVEMVVQVPRMLSFLYGEHFTNRSSSKAANSVVHCSDVLQDIYWYPTMRDEMEPTKKIKANSSSSSNSGGSADSEYVEVTLLPQPVKKISGQSHERRTSASVSSNSSSGGGGSGSSFREPVDSEETVLEPLNHTKNSKFAVDFVK